MKPKPVRTFEGAWPLEPLEPLVGASVPHIVRAV